MFTGIIRAVGQVKNVERRGASMILYVVLPKGWKVRAGDSLATDGACLTVEKVGKGYYQCRLMAETLSRTTFGVAVPAQVNLEPSLTLGGPLDGHLVTGHVDAVGKIASVVGEEAKVYTIQFPKEFKKLVAPKGSITVDGVSLTVIDVAKDSFTVSLVAYTLKHTTLGSKSAGDLVNLEFDILAKYLHAQTRH